jgi:gliding motility-associated protein GldL
MFDKLSVGLKKLSDTSEKLADISEAAIATNGYTESIRKATESVSGFTNNYSQSGQVLNESVNILSENFQKTANTVAQGGDSFITELTKSTSQLESQLNSAGQEVSKRIVSSAEQVANQISSSAQGLSSTYTQMADSMKANSDLINNGSTGYQQQLEVLNKNLAALNAAHELHIQGVSVKLEKAQAVYSGAESMMKKMQSTIDQTEKYADSVAILNQNIAALNNVYGNMLSAMNVMSNGK